LETKTIEHKGIIRQIEGEKIIVQILSQAACASCLINGQCSVSDTKEKDIEVETKNAKDYKIGQSVEVVITENLGLKAAIIAYFIPFLVLMISLILFLQIFKNELISGLLSIGMLLPYYFNIMVI